MYKGTGSPLSLGLNRVVSRPFSALRPSPSCFYRIQCTDYWPIDEVAFASAQLNKDLIYRLVNRREYRYYGPYLTNNAENKREIALPCH